PGAPYGGRPPAAVEKVEPHLLTHDPEYAMPTASAGKGRSTKWDDRTTPGGRLRPEARSTFAAPTGARRHRPRGADGNCRTPGIDSPLRCTLSSIPPRCPPPVRRATLRAPAPRATPTPCSPASTTRSAPPSRTGARRC